MSSSWAVSISRSASLRTDVCLRGHRCAAGGDCAGLNIVVLPHGRPAAAPAGLHQPLATAAGPANRPAAVRARVIAMEVDCLRGLSGLEVEVTPAEHGHSVALDVMGDRCDLLTVHSPSLYTWVLCCI